MAVFQSFKLSTTPHNLDLSASRWRYMSNTISKVEKYKFRLQDKVYSCTIYCKDNMSIFWINKTFLKQRMPENIDNIGNEN